ncbi:hypothetical protein [Nocardia sp. JMUB6875]|uniref:hypothetical protein n=1 Tax=Nocardia sp. JMUB6875 TaxID=3158170 RepID=UPI0034E8CDDC
MLRPQKKYAPAVQIQDRRIGFGDSPFRPQPFPCEPALERDRLAPHATRWRQHRREPIHPGRALEQPPGRNPPAHDRVQQRFHRQADETSQ